MPETSDYAEGAAAGLAQAQLIGAGAMLALIVIGGIVSAIVILKSRRRP